ncbi:hypothetical protein NDU88_008337 [Pleurodeles waltl]|uniref:Uncharacterized protein n=1 Tax=Pleurodeles waltl TaxID=8319 RepID=A0AAV7U2Q9_PLEWA|nr:hypothetical protein NDU88_008337 [Pleurodeles waltl]
MRRRASIAEVHCPEEQDGIRGCAGGCTGERASQRFIAPRNKMALEDAQEDAPESEHRTGSLPRRTRWHQRMRRRMHRRASIAEVHCPKEQDGIGGCAGGCTGERASHRFIAPKNKMASEDAQEDAL